MIYEVSLTYFFHLKFDLFFININCYQNNIMVKWKLVNPFGHLLFIFFLLRNLCRICFHRNVYKLIYVIVKII